MKKTAVILFNLGGPDSESAIQPFLFNLFNDPAIIALPRLFRWLLAHFISRKRVVSAQKIYAYLGGKSPLLPLTLEQQAALEKSLAASEGNTSFKVFTTMRYWHPFAKEVVRKVKDYAPDEIILLPLYPQFSTTTTKSSFDSWAKESAKQRLVANVKAVCCYNTEKDFITSHSNLIKPCYEEVKIRGNPRIIFSAHGLPKKIIAAGDPYQWQIEKTALSIISDLNIRDADWVVSYQSRVGPLEWIGPSTESEIIRAGKDNVPVVIVPVAFVSEHSETLVELDIEYKELAEKHYVPAYIRVPALGTEPNFIQSLATICKNVSAIDVVEKYSIHSYGDAIACKKCPDQLTKCPLA